jgi:magnesium-protoporphyrin O-methyltransferase
MHAVGRFFPSKNRAPTIVPVEEPRLRAAIEADARLQDFAIGRSERIASGFYTSQAMELVRR